MKRQAIRILCAVIIVVAALLAGGHTAVLSADPGVKCDCQTFDGSSWYWGLRGCTSAGCNCASGECWIPTED